MPVYQYKARNKNNKTVSGLVEALSEEIAVETLQEKSFSVTFVKEVRVGKFGHLSIFNNVSHKDVVIFSRLFAVLISANIAMVQALKIVVEQTENVKFKMIISEVADEIDAGTRLSEALAKHPKVFSNFYISVVRSGETSGKLDEVLTYLADEMEKDYDMMGKIKGAMIYPAFVMTGMLGVGIVMMIFVVPKLTVMLKESGTELPFATRVLMGSSDFLANFWWLILFIVVALVLSVRFYIKTPIGKYLVDYGKLRVPIFSGLFQKIYLVRFTRSMHTLIVGGVTITKSLKITADVVNNQIYKELIEETVKQVEDGNSISLVFADSKEIPKMVSQMLNIGEKTGKMDLVLQRITNFYSREIDNTVANLMTLIEPIIMVVMGVAVGMMVAAIIMPMYSMANGV